MTPRRPTRGAAGFTLIELMVVAAVLLVLLALAAPSLRNLLGSQQLQNVQSQLVTDLQFARAEAVRRQLQLSLMVSSQADQSCYVLFIDGGFNGSCDCLRSSGNVCTGSYEELRSVRVTTQSGLSLSAAVTGQNRINFYPSPQTPLGATTARYSDPPGWRVLVSGTGLGSVQTTVNAAGVVSVCSPGGSMRQVAACP